jgi:hypothetical protein
VRRPPGRPAVRQLPRIDAVELLDFVVVGVLIQAVSELVEHAAAEQVVQILLILWFFRRIGVRAK